MSSLIMDCQSDWRMWFPPFAEFLTSPIMIHPGRNDPCASGMKYKKCCLHFQTMPALGGITPIEASITPQGRKRLKELLEEFEIRNARVPAGQQGMVVMDVDELRKRLEME